MPGQFPANKQDLQSWLANNKFQTLPEIIQIKASQNANSVNAAPYRNNMATKSDFPKPMKGTAKTEVFPHLTKSEFCKYVLKKEIPDPVNKDKIIIGIIHKPRGQLRGGWPINHFIT